VKVDTRHPGSRPVNLGKIRLRRFVPQVAAGRRLVLRRNAVDLADLVKPPTGSTQGFISPDLNANLVVKSGYKVSLAADAAAGTSNIGSSPVCGNAVTQPVSSYYAKANPVTPGGTGTRYFATDTRGTIWQDSTGAVANPITNAAGVPAASTAPVQ